MKTKLIIIFVLSLSLSFGAVFNRINTVVNTPAAKTGTIGVFELGFSCSPYYIGSIAYWEDDFYLNYHLTDFLLIGLTRINSYNLAGNLQLLLAKDFIFKKLNLAFGIDNIMARNKTSTFDTLNEKYPNNMSLYLVSTYRMDQWEISAGLGEGRLSNYYSYTFLLSNLFGSVSYYFSKDGKNTGRISFEYDSRDYNIGLVLPVAEEIDINIALTQLPFRSGNNPNYGDIPFQNVSVGLTYKADFFTFYGEEYNKFSKKIKEIEEKNNIIGEKYTLALDSSNQAAKIAKIMLEERNKMKKELSILIKDLKKEKDQLVNEVKALRDVIESEGFQNVQTLKEDIMKHYYRALRYYYNEKYFEAIEELSKAKLINPRIPELHIRLGSIYWKLGLINEAKESWKEAYELDKTNEDFNSFLEEKKIDFEKMEVKNEQN